VAEPVVHDYGNIECRDAVLGWERQELATDEHGQPLSRWDGTTLKPHPVTGEAVPDEAAQVPQWRYVGARAAQWPQADFIVGNPPFIGASTMRAALGDGYVEALRAAWHNRAAGALIVSNFGVYVATSVTATFTPYMNKLLLGSDDTSMSFLFSSFMVAMLSGSALAAWGTRRYARLRVLAAGAGVMFIAALLIWPTAVPGAVPAASAVNALWGLGLGIYALVIFSATLDLSQASAAGAGLLLGLLISTGKIGDSLGGVLVGAILGWAGYSAGAVVDLEMANTLRTTYALSAVLAMTLSVAVLLPQLRSEDRPETPQ
jgi:hypothetical protein